jgi:microcystin-dependent protein
MADCYIAEIRPFAGTSNFIPSGWVLCDGRLLSVSSYQPLFTLIGTKFGGDGVSNFAVPDLRSRLPIGSGQGTGLANNYAYAATGGAESVTLQTAQTPAHTHAFNVSKAAATANTPSGNLYADPSPNHFYATTPTSGSAPQVLNADSVSNTGGGQSHQNTMPSIAINYIIATTGIYPVQP